MIKDVVAAKGKMAEQLTRIETHHSVSHLALLSCQRSNYEDDSTENLSDQGYSILYRGRKFGEMKDLAMSSLGSMGKSTPLARRMFCDN